MAIEEVDDNTQEWLVNICDTQWKFIKSSGLCSGNPCTCYYQCGHNFSVGYMFLTDKGGTKANLTNEIANHNEYRRIINDSSEKKLHSNRSIPSNKPIKGDIRTRSTKEPTVN